VDAWRNILAIEQRPIIGINWQGNPNTEKEELRGRSLPLETFAPIANFQNFSLLSLQKGFGSEQLPTCSFRDRFVTCQDQVNEAWDFLETTAIIANCDLVITSDTSVAHLAGGMGKTIWLLLQRVPDWRWGMESDTTFWYPTMRLFRQKELGNWAEVVERVAAELQSHIV
jgi:ADP-heptose:LPS heptosyltransferase